MTGVWIVVWLVLFNGAPVIVSDTAHEWATKAECEARLIEETPTFIEVMTELAKTNHAEFEYINGGCIVPGTPA